jgi:predicted nucleic acid-binding Zn ribbon protein
VIDRIGDDVGRELSRFGPGSGLAPIVEAWPRAVGVEIARNAWPARLARDGTLHVHTSSAAWAYELRQLEARIRAQLGAVAPPRLRFAVGPLPDPALVDPDVVRRSAIEPAVADRARAAQLAAGIDNETLRKVVAEAAAWSLANADSDRSFW